MKDDKPFKLEFYLNKDGLNIVGNSKGLSQFAEEIQEAAVGGSGYHAHLTFSFHEYFESNLLKINLQLREDQVKTIKVPSEITIYNSEKDAERLLED